MSCRLANALDLLVEQAAAGRGWGRVGMLRKHRSFILRRLGPAVSIEELDDERIRQFLEDQASRSGAQATRRRAATLQRAIELARERGLTRSGLDVSLVAAELLPRKRPTRARGGELVTVADAARMLGLSGPKVVRLETAGALPAADRTAGGHRRFRLADLQAFAARRGALPSAQHVPDLLSGPAQPGSLKEALQQALARFRTQVEDVERSAATLEMHESHAGYLLDRLGADTQLSDIDEEMLDRFVMAERAGRRVGMDGELRTLKPGTIKKRLFTLRLALKLARRRKLITHLPEWPQFTTSYKPRRRFLRSFAEYRRLFDALPLPRAEWMTLCLWTAQHAGDVERMTWEDCDPFSQPPWMFIRNTKNRRDGIRVKMPAPLAEVLRAKWLREQPDRSSPIVLPWRNRGHELPRACRRLGLPPLAAIDLRHTGLSWMIRKKGITKAAMEFAGHSSPTMMAKIYGHALPLQLLEVVEDLESIQHEPEAAIDLSRVLPPAGPGPSLSYPSRLSEPPPAVASPAAGPAAASQDPEDAATEALKLNSDGLAVGRGRPGTMILKSGRGS